jgi:hypothetical protein
MLVDDGVPRRRRLQHVHVQRRLVGLHADRLRSVVPDRLPSDRLLLGRGAILPLHREQLVRRFVHLLEQRVELQRIGLRLLRGRVPWRPGERGRRVLRRWTVVQLVVRGGVRRRAVPLRRRGVEVRSDDVPPAHLPVDRAPEQHPVRLGRRLVHVSRLERRVRRGRLQLLPRGDLGVRIALRGRWSSPRRELTLRRREAGLG